MTESTDITTISGDGLPTLPDGPTMDDFIEAQSATPSVYDQVDLGQARLLNEHEIFELHLTRLINSLLDRETTQMSLAAGYWVELLASHRLIEYDWLKYMEIVHRVAFEHLQSHGYQVFVRHCRHYSSKIYFRNPQPSRLRKLLRWVLQPFVRR